MRTTGPGAATINSTPSGRASPATQSGPPRPGPPLPPLPPLAPRKSPRPENDSFEACAEVGAFLSFLRDTEPHCSATPMALVLKKNLRISSRKDIPSLIRVAATSTSPPTSFRSDWRSFYEEKKSDAPAFDGEKEPTIVRPSGEELLELTSLGTIL